MSDEERDAAGDAGEQVQAAGLETVADADYSDVSDPGLASRLETIHRTMSTLGMRIDALVTSTTSYRSALTDRLNEYADLVTKLTRAQASDLDEYRRANERTLSELRRGLVTSEETLDRVGARIDSMLTDNEAVDDTTRRMLADVRGVLDSQETLGRFLGESLDKFAEQVVGRLDSTERVTATQLEAMQRAIAEVDATPDIGLGALDGRLAGIEDRLAAVASSDLSSTLAGRFETMHAAIDELRGSDTDQVDVQALRDLLTRVEAELQGSGRVAGEAWSELAGLGAKVDAILETSANEAGAVSGLLRNLQDTIVDLASGEVVGALWDEVRQIRASVQAIVDEPDRGADPDVVETIRADVTSLTNAVRDLLDQAEVVDDQGFLEGQTSPLDALAGDVAALRSELESGLVIEPSDAFGASVEQLRGDLIGISEQLSAVGELREEVAELRAGTAAGRATSDDGGEAGDDPVQAELQVLRSGVEDIIARLDEGLVLADDTGAAPANTGDLVDQVATLRDQVTGELERFRELLADGNGADLTPLTARLDRLHDDLAEGGMTGDSSEGDSGQVMRALDDVQTALAHLLDRPSGATGADGGYATVDPDTIDLLREEIRGAGAVSEELVDTLATELKALRRRIRLRAEGEIFSDEQLEVIAEAVARRLAD